MIFESHCPICRQATLDTVAEYRFKPPVSREYWGNPTYVSRRLWILFNTIKKDEHEAVFALSHCTSCDFLFLNPRYSDDEIRLKYETLKRLNSTSKEYSKAPIQFIDERAERICSLVSRFLDTDSNRLAVLDYGGQFGHNLKKFDPSRFEKHVVDFEQHAVYDDIVYKGAEIDDLGAEAYDVILANHVLEHINYPKELLSKLATRLGAGGLIYVEVPCGVFREAFKIREPLTHLNYFSEKCLHSLFELTGLSIVHLNTAYQWITVDKEWCINIIGQKSATVQHTNTRPPQDMMSTRHELRKYPPILYEKLRSKTPLRYLVGP